MRKILLLLSVLPIFVFAQSNNWNKSINEDNAFIENVGQFDGRTWQKNTKIEYAVSQNPFYIFFTKKGLTYRFDKMIRNPNRDKNDHDSPKRTNISELINVNWIGANKNVQIIAENKANHYYSYAIKNFATKEVINKNHIDGYKKITYKNLYDHIDVEYVLHPKGGIEYSVILHPGADISQVKLEYKTTSTHTKNEHISLVLNTQGHLDIRTSLGDVIEHNPFTFYKNSKEKIASQYTFDNNTLSFKLDNYDNTQEVVIDPWVVSPNYATSTAVWEVETDAAGNVYTIGGESPMQLKKYNVSGTLQWTYNTPWDTANVWLGTLATDAAGTSYVTSGTSATMQKVDNAANMVWQSTLSSSQPGNQGEWWSITFNCDQTKLLVGGMKNLLSSPFDFFAAIYEVDIATGNVLADAILAQTNLAGGGGFGGGPEEVRSISSAKNAKYIFLTHKQVGSIDQNLGGCSTGSPVFEVDNGHNYAYKCENYLPQSQNGGGLKALVANDQFLYSSSGDKIYQRSLTTGALINSVSIPGGVSSTAPLVSGIVVSNSGLAVDNCGNIYAGSINKIVKFDPNLNILSQSTISFTAYDVSVNSNGEVIAIGAQSNNTVANRNGKIESIAMSACAQHTLVCCDASFCPLPPLCTSDAAVTFSANTAGGTWSSVPVTAGLNATTGAFDPSIAGSGTYSITYTLSCGSESHDIVVGSCVALTVCKETNGDLTVSGGSNPYTWSEWTVGTSTPITTQTECTSCGGTWNAFVGQCFSAFPVPLDNCTTPTGWVSFGTGATITPPAGADTVKVTEGLGDSLVSYNIANLPSCSATCTPPVVTNTKINPACLGGSDGSINLTVTGSSTYGAIWSSGQITEDISSLTAGTYTVTVTDQADATCVVVQTVIIADGASPTVTATAFPASVCSGDMVTLTGGGATTYVWDNGVTNGVAFATTTTTTYSVTGTDANGCTGTAQVNLTVNNCSQPTASFTASKTNLCINDCINFIDLSTGTNINSWNWSFTGANTTTSNSQNPAGICYATAGTYPVSLTVTDANGVDNTIITNYITVNATPTVTATASPTSVCTGDMVTLTGGGAITYVWDNGVSDGVSITPPITTVYSVTGTDVNGCAGISQVTVIVNNCSQPTAAFTASNTNLCINDCINFIDLSTGTNVNTWNWSFTGANTTTSSSQNPTGICYATAGTYPVSLTITDANGTDSTIITNYITVTVCNPIASFNASATIICENDCISFTDLSTGTNINTWNWSFSGATIAASSSQNPTGICYATAGTYPVSLTITDANGTGDTTITNYITVTACTVPLPIASFTASDTVICPNDCISFTDLSISAVGGITTWNWSFPGSEITASSQQNPTGICYATPGTYPVSLSVLDANGADDTTITAYITVDVCGPPQANFDISDSVICVGDCVNYTDLSSGTTAWQWSFNGGTPSSSNLQTPNQICYLNSGVFNTKLVVANTFGKDSVTKSITVSPAPAINAGSDITINLGSSTVLDAIGSNGIYTWSPPDNLSCTVCPNPTATPAETIIYTVVAANAQGCIAKDSVTVSVNFDNVIFVPNIFSPNGDGNNDVLYVRGLGVSELLFVVYDRWGEKVFQSTSLNNGWNGKFRGKEMNKAVFVFYLKATFTDGSKVTKKGDITLIK